MTPHDAWGRLDEFRSNTTSQNGEDGLIAYLLAAYPDIPKTCLEVGAGDGRKNSNTHTLWAVQGWRALLIEGSPKQFLKLAARTDDYSGVVAYKAAIAPCGQFSLDSIARHVKFPAALGVLSIDIDSCDYWIFAHLEYLRPAIVIVEFNPRIPPEISYCDPEGRSLLRHSAKAVQELAAKKGFRVVACAGPNAVLVSEEIIGTNPEAVPNLPIEALFDHAYRRAKGFSSWLVTSKSTTDVAVYQQPPSTFQRVYGWLRYGGMMLRSRLQRKMRKTRRIDEETRLRIERSGLHV